MSLELILKIVGGISLGLGILTLGNLVFVCAYLPDQLVKKVTYTGGKYWLFAFICLVVLYLKG